MQPRDGVEGAFEPLNPFMLPVFKTGAIGRSAPLRTRIFASQAFVAKGDIPPAVIRRIVQISFAGGTELEGEMG
jgi:hypothetical protein